MAVRSIVKSASGQTSAIKASLKRSVKEKVTSANSWWGEKSTKSSGFANGVSGAMAAWAVKNTAPTSRGNQSMIGMGAGAVSSLPGIGGLVYGLGCSLGVLSGGAQVIGGIAATFTGAGAAVGIPMILKGAVEVVVSVQVLSAAVEGEESKTGREAEEDAAEKEIELPDIPYPGDDGTAPPGEDWEWRGPDEPGGEKGAWFNPKTGETLKPDLTHELPIGPHWDYIPYKNGPQHRIFPDGTILPK